MRNLPPIAGFEKLSLVDWPGHVVAVIFTMGCNFRCSHCHNPSLVYPELFTAPVPKEQVETFISSLDPMFYDGVVVTGGEPTIHNNIYILLDMIKRYGFKVRLDTNGSRPDLLKELLSTGLVDEVAVDYKYPLGLYDRVARGDVSTCIADTISLLAATGRGYVRTTAFPGIHTRRMLRYMQVELNSLTGGSLRWVIQPGRLPAVPVERSVAYRAAS